MKNTFIYLMALLATSLVSCESQKEQPTCDEPVSFVYNSPFELCQGNTAYWAENDEFSIVFKEVTSDSRCAVDVDCVWAGRAEVALRFNNFDQVFNDTLAFGDFTGSIHTDQVEFAGRTIRLLAVSPDNLAGQTIPQNEYKVTLAVE